MKRSMAALVIGNAAYSGAGVLANPVHDAVDLGAKLKGYGFNTLVATDCSNRDMDTQLKRFRQLLDSHDVGLFFFAGHGMQIEGQNFLLAVDTDTTSELDAKHSALPLDKVVDAMSKSTASTKIIILDACRNNPWERAWHRGPAMRGLASVYAPKGTIIGFATSPGEVALDGSGRNGTYTEALLQHIDAPDCSIETMFKRVRNTVAAASTGRQTSWEHTSLSGEFYFNLSLGKLIDEYDDTAIADSLFVIDPARLSHQVITGLKTHNWYRQNPAVDLLTAESVAKMGKSSLFVVGRNLYQAAVGSSGSAQHFIDNFMASTRGFNRVKRKAILDGMLFEIFFGPSGKLRKSIKRRYFNQVFDLQRYEELQPSFDFIAEALVAAGGTFYAIPGKGHQVAITLSTKIAKNKDSAVVDGVYLGGANVLCIADDYADDLDYVQVDADEVAERFSEMLVVPERLLDISFSPPAAKGKDLMLPRGWTLTKA